MRLFQGGRWGHQKIRNRLLSLLVLIGGDRRPDGLEGDSMRIIRVDEAIIRSVR